MSSRSLIVNGLTFLRVPLIFAWLILAIVAASTQGFWAGFIAIVAMFFSGLTDAIDGALARRWNVVSQLGKMADPLMDKVFYVVAFPTLTWLATLNYEPTHALILLIFTILYILRDLWVTFMRSVGTLYGADVAALYLGKVRTALSFPTAGYVYLYLWLSPILVQSPEMSLQMLNYWLCSCYIIEGLMILLNLVSGITYTQAYLPYLKKALEQR